MSAGAPGTAGASGEGRAGEGSEVDTDVASVASGMLCRRGEGRGWLVVLNGQLPPRPLGRRSGVWGWCRVWQGRVGALPESTERWAWPRSRSRWPRGGAVWSRGASKLTLSRGCPRPVLFLRGTRLARCWGAGRGRGRGPPRASPGALAGFRSRSQ